MLRRDAGRDLAVGSHLQRRIRHFVLLDTCLGSCDQRCAYLGTQPFAANILRSSQLRFQLGYAGRTPDAARRDSASGLRS
jgi:hypothetical protein